MPLSRIGGKLYRQGTHQMNEFVTQCGRDRVPIVWFQDKAALMWETSLRKPSSLVWGNPDLLHRTTRNPMMCIILRRNSRCPLYHEDPKQTIIMYLPLGTPTTEIYVMHGWPQRLLHLQETGQRKGFRPSTQAYHCKMNALAQDILWEVKTMVIVPKKGWSMRCLFCRYEKIYGGFCRLRLSKSHLTLPHHHMSCRDY